MAQRQSEILHSACLLSTHGEHVVPPCIFDVVLMVTSLSSATDSICFVRAILFIMKRIGKKKFQDIIFWDIYCPFQRETFQHPLDPISELTIATFHCFFLPLLSIVDFRHTKGKLSRLPATLAGEIQIASFQMYLSNFLAMID